MNFFLEKDIKGDSGVAGNQLKAKLSQLVADIPAPE